MGPERSTVINGHKVEEHYWDKIKRWIVYVDSVPTKETYEQVCEQLKKKNINIETAKKRKFIKYSR